MKYITVSIFFIFATLSVHSQIIFSESFNVILDSTKTIKGTIAPDLKFITQKKDLLEFENIADITLKFGNGNAITIANKFELSKFGSEIQLSGGYLYAEYRKKMEGKFTLEPYSQIQWADARGLAFKYALGMNLRYRFILKEKMGLFFGIGPFYEYEKWGFNGVPDEDLPAITNQIIERHLKIGSYISHKFKANEQLYFDTSLYHQSRFDNIFSSPRFGLSFISRFSVTKYLGFNLGYQFIYDPEPIVPIREDFHKVIFGIAINI